LSEEKDKKEEEVKKDETSVEKKEDSVKKESAKPEGKEEKKDSEKTEGSKEEDKTETDKKKGPFSKDKKKKDPKDDQIKDLKDQLLRQMAEFDNFRKRTDKEKSTMYDAGATDVIAKILPVIDNFERGLSDVTDDTDDAFKKGILMIYKQLLTVINDLGVKEIAAEGEKFNPDLHNAVMHEDDPDKGEQEIVQVLQKGYTFHDKVVRHAMVKVAN